MKEIILESDKTKQIYSLFVQKIKLVVLVSKSISRLELAPAPLLGWSQHHHHSHQHVAQNISNTKIFEAK